MERTATAVTGGPGGSWTPTVPTTQGTPTDPQTVECTLEPAVFPVPTFEVQVGTEEDFAFDGDGHLIYQSGSTILGRAPGGGDMVLGTGAPGDPSGLALRSATELIIAAPDTGSLARLDLGTGSVDTVATGLDGPNGLTADSAGRVFISERVGGVVSMLDVDRGTVVTLGKGFDRPNGIALDESESLLYVADLDGVHVIERLDEDWVRVAPVQQVYDAKEGAALYGLTVDLCGFVLTVDYNNGQVRRIDPDTGDDALLVDLLAGASFGFGALEFGNGGPWPRGTLFTSNRRVVTGLRLDIPGTTPVVSGKDR